MSDAAPLPHPHTVLIADDNEMVRRVLVDYVTLVMESSVLEASNGVEALSMVQSQRPDLVLLDLVMPRLGELEAIPHMRKVDPHLRIVVITGDMSEQVRCDVERLGVELLPKPLTFRALAALLGRGWEAA
jgi:CheY-like chemotaxis protein